MDESLELRLSLFVCLGLSGLYVVYELAAEPSGGHPFGHWLGIIGTVLMVFTETAYSLRKRVRRLRLAGPVRYWLSAHIFTGIVGPFLVLTHTAFQFKGLAGFTMGLTILVVASGFFGRYLYGSVPRSLSGTEATSSELLAQIGQAQVALAELASRQPPAVLDLVQADSQRSRIARSDWRLVLMRGWEERRYRTDLRRQLRRLPGVGRSEAAEVGQLLVRRHNLEQQIRMLQAARRLLSLWHTAHVPIGLALFTSVAVHVAATVYFGAMP